MFCAAEKTTLGAVDHFQESSSPPSSSSSSSSIQVDDDPMDLISQKINNNSLSFFESLKNNKAHSTSKGIFIPQEDADTLFNLLQQERFNLNILISKHESFQEKMTNSMDALMKKIDLLATNQIQQSQATTFPTLQNNNNSKNNTVQGNKASSKWSKHC
ncbi:MAG: hypothetical protein O7C59_01930 [Rickettsia endosymbiont of Ixodes persulcatus]|nr:hypothetical protein [Rickettsia endosymbiont of Ixodes persulcatus]